MSTNAPVAQSKTAAQPAVPPEEQFWVRYSPHNEAPLSGVTSTILHVLAILLLLGIVWLQDLLKVGEENSPVPVEPVRLNLTGGGGGSTNGSTTGSGGTGDQGDPGDETTEGPMGDPKAPRPPPEHKPLELTAPSAVRTEFNNDPLVERMIQQRSTEAFGSLTKLESESRKALRKSVNPGVGGAPSKGEGGSGTDGGRDSGKDKGKGSGEGAGQGKLNQREKRVLRWGMTFNTQNGADYKRQLVGLGAMVGIPAAKEGDFILLRDLNNPEAGKVEDISNLHRIYWIDDKEESVRALFSVLGRPVPKYFVAFFPPSLEKDLLRLELEYTQRKYRTRDEDKIHETKFDVVREGDRYNVRVREVFLRR